jgi:hypothetical protein
MQIYAISSPQVVRPVGTKTASISIKVRLQAALEASLHAMLQFKLACYWHIAKLHLKQVCMQCCNLSLPAIGTLQAVVTNWSLKRICK